MNAVFTVIVALIAVAIQSRPASATPNPCQGMPAVDPQDRNWYSGMYREHDGQVLKRVKAYIERYNAYAVDASTAWVMLSNPDFYPYAYAQVGWLRQPSTGYSSVREFVQFRDISQAVPTTVDVGPASSPGTGGLYDEWEMTTNRLGQWDAYKNGSLQWTFLDDSDSSAGNAPWKPSMASVSAEVIDQPSNESDQGDQIAGDTIEEAGFHEVKVYINGAYVYEDFFIATELHPEGQYLIAYPTKEWFALVRDPYLINGKIWEFDTFDERCPN